MQLKLSTIRETSAKLGNNLGRYAAIPTEVGHLALPIL